MRKLGRVWCQVSDFECAIREGLHELQQSQSGCGKSAHGDTVIINLFVENPFSGNKTVGINWRIALSERLS